MHTFRAGHEYDKAEGYDYNDRYRAALEFYLEERVLNVEELRAIDELSQPEAYAAIRQGARMRAKFRVLPPDELAILCVEIRAALIWNATDGPKSDSLDMLNHENPTAR